jgi:hypothetical protein
VGDLWGYIIAGLLAVGGILAALAKARSSGKEAAKAEYADQTARANEDAFRKQTETVERTNDAKANVDALPTGDAERELRERFTRPGDNG